jgi:glycosyltransferase involved in cell wall biosynthesis
MNPLVSIVTPSFRQREYIAETILSVRKQTYRPLEHVIIDGGSADGTVEILQQYSAASDGVDVQWVSEPDRGHPHAVNKGLARAKGEIVGWLNSDDVYFDVHVVGRVVEAFVRYPEIDVIHGDVAIISADSGIGIFWCVPSFHPIQMLVSNRLSQPTIFLRRSVFEQCKLDERLLLALDYEYWLRLGQSFRFRHIGCVLACDRDQPTRASRVRKEKLMETHEHIRQQYWQRPGLSYQYYRSADSPSRLVYRLKGLFVLLRFLTSARWRNDLAFNGWIDSPLRLVKRQLTYRLGQPLNLRQTKNKRESVSLEP